MSKSKKPHYDLNELKELIQNENTRVITDSSHKGATELGFSVTEIEETVLSLKTSDFHKTMPTKKYQKAWQDVYKPNRQNLKLYIKLQKSFNDKYVIVISFKKAK